MADISVTQLYKSFGGEQVLSDLTFEVNAGERAGIVGSNGSGKTTLFRILSGRLDYDAGQLFIDPALRVGLLEQLPEYDASVTVRDVLWSAFQHIEEMGTQMHEIESKMASGEDYNPALYSRLQTAFEAAGGYDLDVPYNIMTGGLRISQDMQERSFMSLSGGEKTRVSLAKLMLSGTDILLLDEPTNHLDLESIAWLEEYLKSFKGTALIISHDRYFLDNTTNRTLEMRGGKIISWPGNYSYYVDRKQELAEQLEASKKRQDKEIARMEKAIGDIHLWAFMGSDKLHKRAFSMQKRLDRMERIETIRKERKIKSRFSETDQSGEDVYNIENLSVGYDIPLISDFSAQVLRGERIAVLGANGCGKTTLLSTILRQLPPIDGRIYEGAALKCGYLPQVVSFNNPWRNLVDTLLYETNCSVQEARDRLASFGFCGEDVFKQISVLSGGEKTRLKLCLFMYKSVNTLFLDEPTNHLDIMSREWVEDAIDDFSETMIFVSHDRYFINRFATRVWYVEDGKITDFTGSYEQYLENNKRQKLISQNREKREPKAPPPHKAQKLDQKTAEKRNRERQKRIETIERKLEMLTIDMEHCDGGDYVHLGLLYDEKEALEYELLELYEEEEKNEI